MHMFSRAGLSLTFVLAAACTSASSDKQASGSDVEVPLWAMSSPSAEAKQHMQTGERNLDAGHFQQAYEEFKRAVAADSAFGFGYLRVAQHGLSLDEYRTNLQRAAAYAGTANPTEKLLIEMEQKSFARDQQAALDLAQQLVEKEPSNPRSWFTLAVGQFGSGDTKAARASNSKAIELAPAYGASHLYHGSLLLAEPIDLVQAEQHILKGGELWPREPISYDLLGDLRRAQGRLADAAAAYTRQIELDPQEWQGYLQRGHAYTFLGKYDLARADYDAAVRHGTGNQPVFGAQIRAYVSAYAGDIPAAITELDQLVQAIDGMKLPDPEGQTISTLNSEIMLATHAHLFDAAEKALSAQNALILKAADRVGDPEFKRGQLAGIALGQARLAVFKGDYAVSDQKINEYIKLVEKDRNPTKMRGVHAMRAFEALFQKKYDEAIKEFEQGDPNNPYQWYHRALALEGAGRTAEAKALFKKVANYNFNQPGYAAIRGDAVARSQ